MGITMEAFSEEKLQKALYEMYKERWLSVATTPSERFDKIRRYEMEKLMGKTNMSLDDWLYEDNGFGGSLYCCFDEFVDCEYKDEDYIKGLLRDTYAPLKDQPEEVDKIFGAYKDFQDMAKDEIQAER